MQFQIPQINSLIQALKTWKGQQNQTNQAMVSVSSSLGGQYSNKAYSTYYNQVQQHRILTQLQAYMNTGKGRLPSPSQIAWAVNHDPSADPQGNNSSGGGSGKVSHSSLGRLLANVFRAATTGSPGAIIQSLQASSTLGTLGLVASTATAGLAAFIASLKLADITISRTSSTYYGSTGMGSSVNTAKAIKFSESTGIPLEQVQSAASREPLGWETLEPKIEAIRKAKSDREASMIAKAMGLEGFEVVRNIGESEWKGISSASDVDVNTDKIAKTRQIKSGWEKIKREAGETISDWYLRFIEWYENNAVVSGSGLDKEIKARKKVEAEEKENKYNNKKTEMDSDVINPNSITDRTKPYGGLNPRNSSAAYPGAWDYRLHDMRDFEDLRRLGAMVR